jgi:hypothetical protein
VTRCPFVQAVREGRLDDARTIATAGDDPVEPVVADVLIRWAAAFDATLDDLGLFHDA